MPNLASEVEVVKSLVLEASERFEVELRLQIVLPESRLLTLRPGALLPLPAQRRSVGQIFASEAVATEAEPPSMRGVIAGRSGLASGAGINACAGAENANRANSGITNVTGFIMNMGNSPEPPR